MFCTYDCKLNGLCDYEEPCGHPILDVPLSEIEERINKMSENIRVVEISLNGVSCIDEDIEGALLSLMDCQEGDEYTLKIFYMNKVEYESLPEFEGF